MKLPEPKHYKQYKARENKLPVQSAGKQVTGGKRAKTCSRKKARENAYRKISAAEHATSLARKISKWQRVREDATPAPEKELTKSPYREKINPWVKLLKKTSSRPKSREKKNTGLEESEVGQSATSTKHRKRHKHLMEPKQTQKYFIN